MLVQYYSETYLMPLKVFKFHWLRWVYQGRSFHQNQIKLFIMIKGGLLYALKKKFWEMLSPLIVGPKPTKETQLEV